MGGAQQLAKNMEKKLQTKPKYNTRVTTVKTVTTTEMEITTEQNGVSQSPLKYAGVFNSTPLGCLREIDTSGAQLNYATKQAKRSLGYGPASKVGIKFKKAWWIHSLPEEYRIPKGGLRHSDLIIRTCVYRKQSWPQKLFLQQVALTNTSHSILQSQRL